MADVSIIKLENDSYNIKDSTARTNINNLSNYSTNEIIIGSWIDGKPLYRKVFNTTTPNANTGTIATITNLKKIIFLDGYITNVNQQMPMNYTYDSNEITALYVEGNNINFHTNYNNYMNKSCIVICEYTKTTD